MYKGIRVNMISWILDMAVVLYVLRYWIIPQLRPSKSTVASGIKQKMTRYGSEPVVSSSLILFQLRFTVQLTVIKIRREKVLQYFTIRNNLAQLLYLLIICTCYYYIEPGRTKRQATFKNLTIQTKNQRNSTVY